MVYDTGSDSTDGDGENDLDWDDKIAVITGAASGIGAGLARYALDLGMTVYAADLDGSKLQTLDSSSNLHCSGLDVTDAGQLEALAKDKGKTGDVVTPLPTVRLANSSNVKVENDDIEDREESISLLENEP